MVKPLFFSLRPKQWIKNLFLAIPLIFGGKLFQYPENLKALIGVLIFSLASGAVYLINDSIDLEQDKLHPLKKLRPLASGKISRQSALAAIVFLVLTVFFSSLALNKNFAAIVLLYMVSNLLYSKILKNAVIIDVFCIGFFFLMRVLAGCFLVEVEMSHWLLFMTILMALFLGFNKRRQEIKLLGKKAGNHRQVLMRYNRYFIDQMISVVTASIVVVYMLYTVDETTIRKFGTNHLIFSIPFVYYGIFRYLYLLQRGRKEGDPSRIFLMDKILQADVAAWLVTVIAVIYFKL